MEGWLTEQIRDVFRLARKDPQYAQMREKHCGLETRISECLKSMPDETQDLFGNMFAYRIP